MHIYIFIIIIHSLQYIYIYTYVSKGLTPRCCFMFWIVIYCLGPRINFSRMRQTSSRVRRISCTTTSPRRCSSTEPSWSDLFVWCSSLMCEYLEERFVVTMWWNILAKMCVSFNTIINIIENTITQWFVRTSIFWKRWMIEHFEEQKWSFVFLVCLGYMWQIHFYCWAQLIRITLPQATHA